eukprot:TRINITY_DN1581_c0_g1_i2.p1 TRINITY_DN1581_c0_g1~~TRINITY_DN1581_c0_g1_i2.p1  ORF type:complete len:564 (+),score=102.85 TRINITY_DN1581_c0_g1_i2:41-1693(+)
MSIIENLTQDIFSLIFGILPSQELLVIPLVCKSWYNNCCGPNSSNFWRALCATKFKCTVQSDNYYDLYVSRQRLLDVLLDTTLVSHAPTIDEFGKIDKDKVAVYSGFLSDDGDTVLLAQASHRQNIKKMSIIENLTQDIFSLIFGILPSQELLVIPLVCKSWYNNCCGPNSSNFWRALCATKFKCTVQSDNYYDLYVSRQRLLDVLLDTTLVSHAPTIDEFGKIDKDKVAVYSGFLSDDGDTVLLAQASHPLTLLPFGNFTCMSYFETTVINAGQYERVGVGIGKYGYYEGHPGWKNGTWGYHGDDGNYFNGHGFGYRWGPLYTTGDIIGCGVDWNTNALFFTKNGEFIGNTNDKIMRISKLYPIIGLHSHGEKVQVNFGEKPFVFDIVSKINKEGGDNNMTVEIDDEEDFDWDLVEVNPLQPYYTRIKTDINAANDEVFVEDLRKFFPGEDIPIPELFQIVENWYIKEEIELGERKTLSIIPKDERPKEIVYSHENGVLQEILTLLLNDEINDEECMAQYDNEGVFGIAGHLLEEDDQEQDGVILFYVC